MDSHLLLDQILEMDALKRQQKAAIEARAVLPVVKPEVSRVGSQEAEGEGRE